MNANDKSFKIKCSQGMAKIIINGEKMWITKTNASTYKKHESTNSEPWLIKCLQRVRVCTYVSDYGQTCSLTW